MTLKNDDPDLWVAVVAWHDLLPFHERLKGWDSWAHGAVMQQQLADPGNSSLKGVARYLENFRKLGQPGRTVVLLGDVIYSWNCLDAIFTMSKVWGFVGSAGLSYDQGELWGVGWSCENEDLMRSQLADALLRHPPFDDDYQPGQLRRWIPGWRPGALENHIRQFKFRGHFAEISDYTHDIDVPSDLELIPDLSRSAALDDSNHGVTW